MKDKNGEELKVGDWVYFTRSLMDEDEETNAGIIVSIGEKENPLYDDGLGIESYPNINLKYYRLPQFTRKLSREEIMLYILEN